MTHDEQGAQLIAEAAPYRAQIEAALGYAGGSHSYDDVMRGLATGDYQLWTGPTSVVITELVVFPQYTALMFFLAGGNLRELEAMCPLIEGWGREKGCTRVIFTGRKGWERSFLTTNGYEAKLVVFDKEL